MKPALKPKIAAVPAQRVYPEKLAVLADHLIHTAAEFGARVDGSFPRHVAGLGFLNAMKLAADLKDAAAELERMMNGVVLPPAAELAGLARQCPSFAGGGDWIGALNQFLDRRWMASADHRLNPPPQEMLRGRILHGIRLALAVAAESAARARRVAKQTEDPRAEKSFLLSRLRDWSRNRWAPRAAPFVDFVTLYYRPGSMEQQIVARAAAAVYPMAKALDDPWSLSLWCQTGWSAGQNLAGTRPEDYRALLEEVGKEDLQCYHHRYQSCVLGTLGPNDEVRVERAVLRFFAEVDRGKMARCHCGGREPRLVARAAFDFAFWMGLFSAAPLPAAN